MSKYLKNCFFFLMTLLVASSAASQEHAPRVNNTEITTTQFLNFGAFTIGNGRGSISVDHQGTRSSSGDVFLLNMGEPVSPALFEIKAKPGTILNIIAQNDIYLRGENGGRARLQLDSFSPGEMFISSVLPPHANSLYVGGTLFLESSSGNPAGLYSGTFTVTVVHQ